MTARRPDLQTPEWKRLRLAVLNRDGWRCTYCGKPLEGRDAQADHIVPFVSVAISNHMSNLVAACGKCNGTKQDRVTVRLNWANPRWLPNGAPL